MFACTNRQDNTNRISKPITADTFIKHDTIYLSDHQNQDWQHDFNLTHNPAKDTIWGKPVNYYLDDPDCVGIAFEFYYGYFRPSDNGATDELLKYASTSNQKLRPFYRWCLDKTIEIADGALWEHIGTPALKYVAQYPKEFLDFIDQDTSNTQYKNWTNAIAYSGFEAANETDLKKQREKLIATMKSNCKDCNIKILKQIEQFGKDCE